MKNLIFLLALVVSINAYGQEPKALAVGSKAPEIEAIDNSGSTFSLSEKLKQGPAVVIFYRGEWCPYCNKHMSQLEESIGEFKDLGVSVVAIAPELPEFVEKSVKKSKASFSVISDPNHQVMDAWNVSFRLDDETYKRYKKWGINLERASGNEDRILPVPATYIIGTDGTIKHVHFDPNYKERMPVSEMLEILGNKQ